MPAPQAHKDESRVRLVDPYPAWYRPLKWLLPISVALLAGLTLGLATTGVLPIPAMMGKAVWLPVIYSSLDTLQAVGMLLGLTSALSSVVGLSLFYGLRATVLFDMNEKRGWQGQKAQERVDELNADVAEWAEYGLKLREENKLLKAAHGRLDYSSSSDSEDSSVVAEHAQAVRASRGRNQDTTGITDAVKKGELTFREPKPRVRWADAEEAKADSPKTKPAPKSRGKGAGRQSKPH